MGPSDVGYTPPPMCAVQGRVSLNSGMAILGVKVTITDVVSGRKWSTTSDYRGYYQFGGKRKYYLNAIPAGKYTLEITLPTDKKLSEKKLTAPGKSVFDPTTKKTATIEIDGVTNVVGLDAILLFTDTVVPTPEIPPDPDSEPVSADLLVAQNDLVFALEPQVLIPPVIPPVIPPPTTSLDVPDVNWNTWVSNEPPNPTMHTGDSDLAAAYRAWYMQFGESNGTMVAALIGPRLMDPNDATPPLTPEQLADLIAAVDKLIGDGKLVGKEAALIAKTSTLCRQLVLNTCIVKVKEGKPAGYKLTKADHQCLINGMAAAAVILKLTMPDT